jgi:predicted nucleic acid-binding Zn ribbon protein
VPDDRTAESMIRHEIERRREAFTFLALGICIMVVALIFLGIFAWSGDIIPMAGSFVVVLLGLFLYNKGHQGRVQVRALEHQLATLGAVPGQASPPGQSSTKFCKHCGKLVAKDSSFCEHCGRSL